MIYLEAAIHVAPGKMKEFMDVFTNQYLPASERLGRRLIGQWRTFVGPLDEVVDLWAYDDLSHMQRFQEARSQSAEFKEASEHLRALIAYETTRLLVPTPLSLMK